VIFHCQQTAGGSLEENAMISPLGRRGNPLTGESASVKGIGAVAAASKRDDPVRL